MEVETSSGTDECSSPQSPPPPTKKKKHSLPVTPDSDTEVIALSPRTLLATNRFVCEVCNKGFQREENLQLHRRTRSHNLPWKLKQKNALQAQRRRVYLCPEPTCVHHHPSRALGDLSGIKKHFCRKHGEKKWKCDKRYAVQSDWKAHSNTCGTREYRCDCGTLFSRRRGSFITHRAFCDILAHDGARLRPSGHLYDSTGEANSALVLSTVGSHLAEGDMQPSHFPTQRVARLLQNLRSKGTSEPSQNSTVKQVHAGGWYGDKQWVRDKPPMLQRSLSHMHDLVNIAEWWVHDDAIARLLQEAKDAAYCADDLLDELKYYELHYNLDAIQYQFRECYEEIKKDIQEKIEEIDHLINQMGHLRLRDMRQLFIYELAFIPKVDPFAEKAIVGREEDLTKLIRLLDLQGSSSACEAEINRARPENVSVLPVVGSGGVGKTALVHHIFSEKRVQDHFDQLIWMHTSEGFDEKKLITRLIWSLAENEMRSDDLSCLQRFLSNGIIHHSKRLLLVLDDVQEDVCKEDLNGWRSFLAPLKCARSGSTVLVTTRSLKVAEHLGTMKPFVLDGLTYESLWELFRMNAFGSDNSKCNQELGGIGRRIVARLNGSSLGAKILGRLLTMKLDAIYWENILESELWDMPHREMIGSNPALLLSYQYMPSHLRHCFSFCSLYPKDYNLEAEILVNCWVAVGLVAPDGDTLAADIGHLYFQQLVGRSFLQRVTSSKYVMHGLLYDMAQRISSNECFVIKGRDDFLRLPPKVRHVSILGHSGLCSSDLESLKAYTTLRSVVCISIDSNVITTSVLETWFYHLTNLRMLRFISCRLKELPGNVGSLILLRYLDISSCDFEALPDSFWRLDNIEILDAKNCRFHCVPKDIVKLVNLRKVKLKGDLMNQLGCISGVGKLMLLQEMPCYAICDSPGRGIEELKNLNNLRGALEISGIHNVTSKEQAAEADLDKKIHLNTLVLSWHDSLRPDKHNSEQEMEVLEGLRPSPSIKNLEVRFYMGSGIHPSWLLYGEEDEPISSRLES